MNDPTPLRSNHPRRADLDRLAAVYEEIGSQKALIRLRELGEIHCLAPEVRESDLIRALGVAGLALSSVDGVQLIHRLPPPKDAA